MEEKKLYILVGLDSKNIEEYYKRNFERWLFKNSHEVSLFGEKIINETYIDDIGYIERQLQTLNIHLGDSKEGQNLNNTNCEVSGVTEDGFPLTEHTFIEEQLKKYEPLYNKTIGSTINRRVNLKLKDYIEFLTQKRTQQEKKPEKLSLRQIALIYQYENWPLTDQYANSVAKEYGWKSGKKLVDQYRKFNTPNQRTGEGVETTNDIRTILPKLSNEAKKVALNELQKATENQTKKRTK